MKKSKGNQPWVGTHTPVFSFSYSSIEPLYLMDRPIGSPLNGPIVLPGFVKIHGTEAFKKGGGPQERPFV